MGSPQDYDPELLVDAVTALDWSIDHPTHAIRAIQETIRREFGDEVSDRDAMKLLGKLIDRRFIRTRIEPQVTVDSRWRAGVRKAKYVRVPENER